MLAISPTQSNVLAALNSFLGAILPGISGSQPAVFTGTISGTTLMVTALPGKVPAGIQGTIQLYAPLLGIGIASGTTIQKQLSGTTGGIGAYQISIVQSVSQQITMSTGVTVLQGQQNRAPEPANPYFAIMVPIRIDRLATNEDTSVDVKFVGSISGNTLTVSDIEAGTIVLGSSVFGTGVSVGTQIVQFLSGTGGNGTYQVSPSQNALSQTMSGGGKIMVQEAEWTIQMDFHSPDSLAGDLSQLVSTSLRDEFGTNYFANLPSPLNGVSPLYADNPHQVPFINAENQYEYRWSLDCCIQINQAVLVPSTFADSATLTLVDVDALFPP